MDERRAIKTLLRVAAETAGGLKGSTVLVDVSVVHVERKP